MSVRADKRRGKVLVFQTNLILIFCVSKWISHSFIDLIRLPFPNWMHNDIWIIDVEVVCRILCHVVTQDGFQHM